jgi:hypothetical protein
MVAQLWIGSAADRRLTQDRAAVAFAATLLTTVALPLILIVGAAGFRTHGVTLTPTAP